MSASGHTLSPTLQVDKLLNSFCVETQSHLGAMVETNPALKNDFDAAAAFIQGQLTSEKLKNGTPHAGGKELVQGTEAGI